MKKKLLIYYIWFLQKEIDNLSKINDILIRNKVPENIIDENISLKTKVRELQESIHGLKYGKVGIKTEDFVPKMSSNKYKVVRIQ